MLRLPYIFYLLFIFSFYIANAQQKPNIIYILADDLGYGDVGCYGQKTIRTPHIDSLAKEGLLFTQHYAGAPVCAPSRAVLMTGRDIGHARVRGNYETGPNGLGTGLELADDDITMAEVLKQRGYTTALVGKWGLGVAGTTGEPVKQGFDYSYGYLNQAHAHNHFPDHLFRNGERVEMEENKNGQTNQYSNNLFTEEAIQFVSSKKGNPFFLYLAFTTPHAELLVPDDTIFRSYKGQFEEQPFINNNSGKPSGGYGGYRTQLYPKAAYAASITYLDQCIGRIVSYLKQNGLYENTLIIFSSDNGPAREGGANPAYFESSGGLRGMKRDVYEGGIRVPMIAVWPGVIKKGMRTAHISGFQDIMPTLAEAAGAPLPAQVSTEGLSFFPLLNNKKQRAHDYLYWEFHENKTTNQAIRKGRWKGVRMAPDLPLELYDMTSDPAEKKNVAGSNPKVVQQLEALLDKARVPHPLWPVKGSVQKK